MDKEVYVDCVHKDSQTIGIYSMESKQELAIYNPRPEDTKVIIWGYELCNGAEWQDFLDVVNKLGEENQALKDRWQKLKEWAGCLCYFELLDKMEELEKELKDGTK